MPPTLAGLENDVLKQAQQSIGSGFQFLHTAQTQAAHDLHHKIDELGVRLEAVNQNSVTQLRHELNAATVRHDASATDAMENVEALINAAAGSVTEAHTYTVSLQEAILAKLATQEEASRSLEEALRLNGQVHASSVQEVKELVLQNGQKLEELSAGVALSNREIEGLKQTAGIITANQEDLKQKADSLGAVQAEMRLENAQFQQQVIANQEELRRENAVLLQEAIEMKQSLAEMNQGVKNSLEVMSQNVSALDGRLEATKTMLGKQNVQLIGLVKFAMMQYHGIEADDAGIHLEHLAVSQQQQQQQLPPPTEGAELMPWTHAQAQ